MSEWVLVPREPTAAMLHAYQDCPYESGEDKWSAMLTAIPAYTSSNGSLPEMVRIVIDEMRESPEVDTSDWQTMLSSALATTPARNTSQIGEG